MRKIVPQRIIKSRFRLFFTLSALFLLTLVSCIAVLFFFFTSRSGIISPLGKYLAEVRDDQAIKATVLQTCQKDMLSCQNISVQSDGSIRLSLDSDVTVLLSTGKDLQKQLASLQKVASQLTIKGKRIKQVDFRFDNVTVTF